MKKVSMLLFVSLIGGGIFAQTSNKLTAPAKPLTGLKKSKDTLPTQPQVWANDAENNLTELPPQPPQPLPPPPLPPVPQELLSLTR